MLSLTRFAISATRLRATAARPCTRWPARSMASSSSGGGGSSSGGGDHASVSLLDVLRVASESTTKSVLDSQVRSLAARAKIATKIPTYIFTRVRVARSV